MFNFSRKNTAMLRKNCAWASLQRSTLLVKLLPTQVPARLHRRQGWIHITRGAEVIGGPYLLCRTTWVQDQCRRQA
jgi:hypothetical protein